jgi:hypothetical protein
MERACQSPHCTCPAPEESDFCSARCSAGAVGVNPPAECDCGHEACQGGGRPDAVDPSPRQ